MAGLRAPNMPIKLVEVTSKAEKYEYWVLTFLDVKSVQVTMKLAIYDILSEKSMNLIFSTYSCLIFIAIVSCVNIFSEKAISICPSPLYIVEFSFSLIYIYMCEMSVHRVTFLFAYTHKKSIAGCIFSRCLD